MKDIINARILASKMTIGLVVFCIITYMILITDFFIKILSGGVWGIVCIVILSCIVIAGIWILLFITILQSKYNDSKYDQP